MWFSTLIWEEKRPYKMHKKTVAKHRMSSACNVPWNVADIYVHEYIPEICLPAGKKKERNYPQL